MAIKFPISKALEGTPTMTAKPGDIIGFVACSPDVVRKSGKPEYFTIEYPDGVATMLVTGNTEQIMPLLAQVIAMQEERLKK